MKRALREKHCRERDADLRDIDGKTETVSYRDKKTQGGRDTKTSAKSGFSPFKSILYS